MRPVRGAPRWREGRSGSSERDVVVDVGVVAAGRRHGSPAGRPPSRGGLGRRRGAGAAIPLPRFAVAAPAQHLHLVCDDLGGVAVLSILALPLPGLDSAFDVDLSALAQVLLRDLGESAEHHHPVPFRILAPLVGLPVGPALAGGNTDVRDRAAARAVANLGVGPEIADENDLVYAPCHALLLRVENPSGHPRPALRRRCRACPAHCASHLARFHPSAPRSRQIPTNDEPASYTASYAVPPPRRID